jgi:hypothetical protein
VNRADFFKALGFASFGAWSFWGRDIEYLDTSEGLERVELHRSDPITVRSSTLHVPIHGGRVDFEDLEPGRTYLIMFKTEDHSITDVWIELA